MTEVVKKKPVLKVKAIPPKPTTYNDAAAKLYGKPVEKK